MVKRPRVSATPTSVTMGEYRSFRLEPSSSRHPQSNGTSFHNPAIHSCAWIPLKRAITDAQSDDRTESGHDEYVHGVTDSFLFRQWASRPMRASFIG